MVLSRRSGSGVISPVSTPMASDKPDFSKSKGLKPVWRVFSSNPDKAWAEKAFLAYSPVWPILFGAWCISGYHLDAGDAGNLAVTLLIALPDVLIPMLFCPSHAYMPWWQTYWFKYLVWIALFTFVASYFWTEYFFDVLGMKYNFSHLTWNLDSQLLGSGRQVVPVMMYFHAWYFFVTYHTCSVILIRMTITSPLTRILPKNLLWVLTVAGTAWLCAWGEIYGTTLEEIKEQFEYADQKWALKWGALLYSCYFIASLPIVYGLDEEVVAGKGRWGMQRVVQSSLAAGMVGFILLDLAIQFVVTDWQLHTHVSTVSE